MGFRDKNLLGYNRIDADTSRSASMNLYKEEYGMVGKSNKDIKWKDKSDDNYNKGDICLVRLNNNLQYLVKVVDINGNKAFETQGGSLISSNDIVVWNRIKGV